MPSVEISTSAADTPSLPMNGVWGTIRSYILWQHERGTLHYDIMVTLILIFVFFSPKVINFNDKPTSVLPHPTGVVVSSDGAGGLVYEIDASAVAGSAVTADDESTMNARLQRVIEPISGDVSIVRYENIFDAKGQVQGYRVWAKRK